MPRRRPLIVAAAGVLTLAGCSSAVEVAAPGAADSPACVAAAAAWPLTLGNLATVETSPTVAAVRAWGDPAIIARCGVPALPPTTDQCIDVDGIDWVAEELTDGTRLTTFGRDPAIEVLVPAAHDPAPLLLPGLDEAARALPTTGRSCS